VDYMRIADKTWPVIFRVMGGHTAIYRATGGRIGKRLPGLKQMLLLDHVGAKSGERRTAPLLYVDAGDEVAIIASKGGYPKNPAWFYNLKANPETKIRIGGEQRPVRARLAKAEEREELWAKAVRVWPAYDEYQERSKGREIPVMVLERR